MPSWNGCSPNDPDGPVRSGDPRRAALACGDPWLGTDALPRDTPVLFGMTWEARAGSPKLEATWARLDGGAPDATAIGPTDRTAWLTMIAEHGPSALLMLNGRRHRRMVPPEIEQRIAQLQSQLGLEVRFHPLFEWPEMREDAVRQAEAEALAAFGGHRGFQCDITGETIAPAQAAVLTPWEFRRSPLRARLLAEVGHAAEVLLAANWSDWVVRRDLAAMAAA